MVTRLPSAVNAMTVGTGRNDGVNRLYATTANTLYELTYVADTEEPPIAFTQIGIGHIEWTGVPDGGVCDIEWSSDLTNPNGWRRDWSSLIGIVSTGGTSRAEIPVFFRVKKRSE